jgi:uncharacterized protein YkwD
MAVLQEINLARTRPQQYAQLLVAEQAAFQGRDGGRALREAVTFLNHEKPLRPLSFSSALALGAMSHVISQGGSGATGHEGFDRSSPWERMARFGKWIGTAGENISYGISSPRGIVMNLIVDAGVGNRAHRKNIFHPGFGVAGIACGWHARYGTMCVIDFAGGFIPSEAVGYESGGRQAPSGEKKS